MLVLKGAQPRGNPNYRSLQFNFTYHTSYSLTLLLELTKSHILPTIRTNAHFYLPESYDVISAGSLFHTTSPQQRTSYLPSNHDHLTERGNGFVRGRLAHKIG